MTSDRYGDMPGRRNGTGSFRRGVLLLLGMAPLWAQFDPDNAKALIYIPQLADGGDAVQRWRTTIQITSAARFPSECRLEFLSPSAQPLAMDFGSGASATATISIPAGGRATLRSPGTNPEMRTGWAIGRCTYPVTVSTLFRLIDRGRETVEITTNSATPTPYYYAAANRELGIAIANISATAAITVALLAMDQQGRTLGVRELPLCPRCQITGNLGTWFPDLTDSFEGTAIVKGLTTGTNFVAWALHSERGLLASLPDGSLSWPGSHADRISEIWSRLLPHATRLFPKAELPTAKLNIGEDPVINAFARKTHEVTINLALAELLSSCSSELAAVIGHEIAHLVQYRLGRNIVIMGNAELDADAVATILLLSAGYDPYATAGALGKLMMATRRASLVAQTYDDINDPHTSFINRIGRQMDLLDRICANPDFSGSCAGLKQYLHPHFPAALPLGIPNPDVPAPVPALH